MRCCERETPSESFGDRSSLEAMDQLDHDPSIAQVHIDVVDINENPPHFERETFHAGKSLGKPFRLLLMFIEINFHTFFFISQCKQSRIVNIDMKL